MSIKQVSTILLVVAVISLLVYYNSASTPQFDYYRFSFEFLGAVCLNRDCQSADLGNTQDYDINMHGFWPQKDSGSIDFCLYNGYDETKLKPEILDTINANWVGAYNPTNTFRNHEWGKHGTCWAQQYYINSTSKYVKFLKTDNYYELMNQYFELVMKIKRNAGLEELFFGNKTNPRMVYDFTSLNNLMGNRFGVQKVETECETINGEQYLTEARYCLDLNYNFIDCPTLFVSCKPGDVVVQAYIK